MERDDSSTAGSASDERAEEADGWQFGDRDTTPVETDSASPSDSGFDAEPEAERRGSVAGGTDRRLPVEPEPVSLESAVFVLLGVVVTLAVFAQFVVG
ncbi:hypothetical protein N0B31_01310 [Salinirubellus salinus]|uniref:DUF7312 domain-containing protein n=1 Tax=Salinirubellus salinus TaxID=1364945 RepID=A0A9E7R3U6_9EURY|nr:hypothetical protein [Salinirubellus salinus]UWM54928.1 hypothetical protein N0B31_01310 [Salinirubellus salinus]